MRMFNFNEMGFGGSSFGGKDALETMSKSYAAMTRSVQTIAQETADYSKKSFEDSVAHMQKLSGVRSIEAAVELQTAFIKSSYEGYVSQATKLGTLYTDLAKTTYKPYEAPMAQAANAMQTAKDAATSAVKTAAA
jgi:hypothetical protein